MSTLPVVLQQTGSAQLVALFGENTKEEDQKWRTAKLEVLHDRIMLLKTEGDVATD